MTKRDFEFFAGLIRVHHNLIEDYDALDSMMEWFHMRNPNFDHYRFLKACEFEDEEIADIWDLGPLSDSARLGL